MIALAFLALMSAQAQTPATASQSTPSTDQVVEPPDEIKLTAVSPERTIAAFMNLCIRPMWDEQKVKDAIKQSDFRFKDVSDRQYPQSFRWQASRAALGLDIDLAGSIRSQCELSMAAIQPRTGQQILAMLKPALEAELGHGVRVNNKALTIEWDPPDWSFVDRISLADAGSEPSQALWFIFDEVPRDAIESSYGQ